MQPSSAFSIPYDLRPSKQAERRLIIDILLAAVATGTNVDLLPYIGMGGIKFIDFVMMHKFVGTTKFISIERDRQAHARCDFNKPFGNIRIFKGDTSEFIDEFGTSEPHILWLDYDSVFSRDIFDDLIDIGPRLGDGSFLFITISGEPAGVYRKMSSRERLEHLKKIAGDFVGDIADEELDDDNFRIPLGTILLRIMNFSFRSRYPIRFMPVLKFFYKDSSWMITIGGMIGDERAYAKFLRRVRSAFSFLPSWQTEEFYELPQFNLTDSERKLLDMLVTQTPRDQVQTRLARRLGFSKDYVRRYHEMLRYIPRFFESAL